MSDADDVRKMLGALAGFAFGVSGAARRHPKHPVVGGITDGFVGGITGFFVGEVVNAIQSRARASRSAASAGQITHRSAEVHHRIEIDAETRGMLRGLCTATTVMSLMFENLEDDDADAFLSEDPSVRAELRSRLRTRIKRGQLQRHLRNEYEQMFSMINASVRRHAVAEGIDVVLDSSAFGIDVDEECAFMERTLNCPHCFPSTPPPS